MNSQDDKVLGVGIAGPGVVGGGFLKILKEKANTSFQVLSIASSNPNAEKHDWLNEEFPGITHYDNPLIMIDEPKIDIIVETMGTIDLAYKFISEALSEGKSVITANKDLMAVAGKELLQLAKDNNVGLYYEASVMGGVPAISEVKKMSNVDKIDSILAIVNGTGNFILTDMAGGEDYLPTLKKAQDLGFAESNPKNDVEGIDSGYKLKVLLWEAFSVEPDDDKISIEGITGVTKQDIEMAKSIGKTIKLLAYANREVVGEVVDNKSKVGALVAPIMVPSGSKMGITNGSDNRLEVDSNNRNNGFDGQGAGDRPTGAAVYEDLLECAKNYENGEYIGECETWDQKVGVELMDSMDLEFKHYISISYSGLDTDVIGKLNVLFEEEGLVDRGTYLQHNENDARGNIVLNKTKTSELIKILEPFGLDYKFYRIVD